MLMKITQVRNPNYGGFQQIKNKQKPQALFHRSFKDLMFSNFKGKHGIQTLSTNHSRLEKFNVNRRDFAIYSSVEPGVPPSGPPSNILTWIAAVALAIVVPFIGSQWGPSLRKKIENVMQMTENVAEAVEKVAEQVEKVAEDVADDLPKGGKLREVVDYVEKLAERTAKDAGLVDDFIDKVQEEEEKADSIVESFKDESKEEEKADSIVESFKDESKEEEKADSIVESLKDESKEAPAELIIEQKPNDDDGSWSK